MKRPVSNLIRAAAFTGLLSTFGSVRAATNNPFPPLRAINLIGSWTNEAATVLTITSADDKTGKLEGSYRLAYTGAGGARPLAGWVHTNGIDPRNTNRVIGLWFSVDWGREEWARTWKGFYTVLDGKDTVLGMWMVPREDPDPALTARLRGEDRFHRQGSLGGK